MDHILIRDLLVRGIVGVNEEERRERQDVLINVELRVDTRAAAGSDDLTQSVNYRSVAKRLVAHVEAGSPLLVERLADELARIVLTEFPVSSLRLRVEKPGALRFARSVGIEIERRAEDYGGGA
jgi:FolB domain-containing protein